MRRSPGSERGGRDARGVIHGGEQEIAVGSAMACKQGPHGPTDDATCSNSVHLQIMRGLEFDVEPTRRWAGLLVGDLV